MNLNLSARALSLSRPLRDFACAECGKAFQARDTRARYCSDRCKQRAKHKRKKSSSGALTP
jgi:predicted nucleic acid-binding Zn ribbon protein